jgi:hypothetical protein
MSASVTNRPSTNKPKLFDPPSGLSGFIVKFSVLRGARRELWLSFLPAIQRMPG